MYKKSCPFLCVGYCQPFYPPLQKQKQHAVDPKDAGYVQEVLFIFIQCVYRIIGKYICITLFSLKVVRVALFQFSAPLSLNIEQKTQAVCRKLPRLDILINTCSVCRKELNSVTNLCLPYILYVQEVVAHLVNYYIKWVTY